VILLNTKTSCEVTLTHLKNKQFITSHTLLLEQSESLKKSGLLKSALLYMLAGECKTRQGKTSKNKIKESGELFLKTKKPIMLLDIGLPDLEGDVVGTKLLKEKIDL